jgi:hypothetical protein
MPLEKRSAGQRQKILIKGEVMQILTHSLTNFTLRFWKERTGEKLVSEDARQILRNTYGFFSTLAEWDARTQATSGSSICSSYGSFQGRGIRNNAD